MSRSKNKNIGSIRVGRYTIPFRVYGDPGASIMPIVCVNGAQQTMAAWRSFVSRFKGYFRVVLFDLPGQGRAVCHEGPEAATLDEQCAVLEKIVDTVAPTGRVHVIAASWGGIIASAFAARAPDRVEHLLLASFGLRANAKLMSLMDLGMRLIEAGESSRCGEVIIESFASHVSDGFKRQIVDQFRNMSRESLSSFHTHMAWCRQTVVVGEVDFTRIQAKTLVVVGEYDPIIDLADAKEVNADIPDCELVVVPQAGHFLHFENPAILALYERFFLPASISAARAFADDRVAPE